MLSYLNVTIKYMIRIENNTQRLQLTCIMLNAEYKLKYQK